eukprot:m.769970 g.769970  ORF g.769970 m.769970 type:complete len:341 (+) comp23238_c3_seq4:247-1269(+)
MGEWDQFRMPTDDTNITFGKVAFGYESKNAGELTITAGEYITILQRDDGKGWSRAVSTQKEVGYVPANYFHEISEQEFTASRQKTQPSRAPPPPPTSQSSQDSGEQVKALYSFDARDTTQVSFQKGDVLVVIENSSPDWWKVRTRTGAEGFAPSNYVTVIEGKTPQTARPVSSIVPSMNIDFSSGYASKSELEPTAEDDGPLYETIREDKRPPPARAAPKAPTAPKAPVTSTLSAPVAAAPNQGLSPAERRRLEADGLLKTPEERLQEELAKVESDTKGIRQQIQLAENQLHHVSGECDNLERQISRLNQLGSLADCKAEHARLMRAIQTMQSAVVDSPC